MYISQLRIENYRSFRDFTIKLKPLTLIIGENNVGKSNLLDSIGLIFSQEISFFKRRLLEVSDFNHDSIYNLRKKILDTSIAAADIEFPIIKITATLKDWDANQESVIGDWYSNDELSEASLTYIFAPNSKLKKEDEIKQQRDFIDAYRTKVSPAVFDPMPEDRKLALINFPISSYQYTILGGRAGSQASSYNLSQLKFELLDALRDAKTELVASHNNRLLFRVLNSKNESEYQDLRTNLISLQEAIEGNAALKAIKGSISIQLDKISLATPSQSNLVDFIFALPEVEDLLKKISLIYGEHPIRIERNGTGRNNLLFISLILSFIEDTTRAQSAYFRVIGLEEPEAHLHPNLQDHLAANIESLIKKENKPENRKDIQLLITSHSTHITTKIDFENTVVLYMDDNQIKPHYIFDGFSGNAAGVRHLRYLNKYLDAVNTNLFYSRKVIMVEGISERLLIPIFFRIHARQTVEKAGCCIVNVNGLAFVHFLEIIKNGYFIKCLVLTDSDTGKAKAVENRAPHLRATYSAHNEISIETTTESTFEKDVIAANRTGAGKLILLNALKSTRPVLGAQYETALGVSDIEIDKFFMIIEDYKSDFAFHLMTELNTNSAGFVVPTYITKGLDFINS